MTSLRVTFGSLGLHFSNNNTKLIVPCDIGTILDLPYIFKGDGSQTEMTLDPDLNLDAFIEKLTGKLIEFLSKCFS